MILNIHEEVQITWIYIFMGRFHWACLCGCVKSLSQLNVSSFVFQGPYMLQSLLFRFLHSRSFQSYSSLVHSPQSPPPQSLAGLKLVLMLACSQYSVVQKNKVLISVSLTSSSDKIQNQSNESYRAVLSCVLLIMLHKVFLTFKVGGWNPKVWPFK